MAEELDKAQKEAAEAAERRETHLRRLSANAVLRALHASEGRSASWVRVQEMVAEDGLEISEPTLRKARDLLKELGTIRYSGRTREWVIEDDGALLPRHYASTEHIDAMHLATSAIRQDFAGSRLASLIQAVLYDVQEARRDQGDAREAQREKQRRKKVEDETQTPESLLQGSAPIYEEQRGMHPRAVVHTNSTFEGYDPDALLELARACRRRAIRFRYESVWGDKSGDQEVEPILLRLHDGIPYLRAYSRRDERWGWFRVSRIHELVVGPQFNPLARKIDDAERSLQDESTCAMATGVDHDRPARARITLKGPMADWARTLQFSADQEDDFSTEGGGRLERTFSYRSCREMARRLCFFGDALCEVEPVQLRQAIVAHAEALGSQLGG